MSKPAINLQDPKVLEDAVKMLKSQFAELYVGLGYDQTDANNAWHTLRTSKKGLQLREQVYKGAPHLQATTFIADMDQETKDRLKSRLKATKEPKTPKIQDLPALEPVTNDQATVAEEVSETPAEVKMEIVRDEPTPEVVATDETLKNEIEVSTKKKGSSKPKAAEKAKTPKKEAAPKKEKAPKAEKKPAAPKKEGAPQRGELKQKVQAEIDKGIIDTAKIMEATGASKIYVNWLLKQNKKK